MTDRIDTAILGTGNANLTPVVEHLTQHGIDVLIIACGISKELKEAATDYIEIPESMLE